MKQTCPLLAPYVSGKFSSLFLSHEPGGTGGTQRR
jgi:hypothetical protein